MNVDFVADYLIEKGDKPNGEPLTQLSLQKLVYLCQGWHLALMDEALFQEETYAYQYGPVVKELRKRFRFFGAESLSTAAITNAGRILSHSSRRVIDDVWDKYAKIPTNVLVSMTHEPGSPWSQVWEAADPEERENLLIQQSLIRDWFKAKLAKKLKPRPTKPRDLKAAFEKALAGA